MSIVSLTKEKYQKEERWNDFFKNGKSLNSLVNYHPDWTVLFAGIRANKKFKETSDKLKKIVAKNEKIKIFPFPRYVFSAFSATPASSVKVVIIGQDPYFHCIEPNNDRYVLDPLNNKYVPEAMGLSFSVPHGIKIPSSLDNIYNNMIKFGHIKGKPKSGNLWFWAAQGCLMLNAALTVEDQTKEAHIKMWEWMTDSAIQYISDHMTDIIFVFWGAYAYKKIELINIDKHHTIISSHPSGMSAHKKFQNYPAFMEEDHFGKINQILEKTQRTKILWE